MKIILGSSSVGRKMVMKEISDESGFDFDVLHPDIDEKAIRREDPGDLVMAIANAKADALILKNKEPAILVACDQVVLYKNNIREKPKTENEARDFLQSYSIFPPELIGAVVVVNTQTGKRASGWQKSKVHFKVLPEEIIEQHIKSGASFAGAGGFQIQDPILKEYVDKVEGGFDSVVGLSKELVKKLIAEVESESLDIE